MLMSDTMFSTLMNRRMSAKQPYTRLSWVKPDSTATSQSQYISTGVNFEHGMKFALGIEFINTPNYTVDFGHHSGVEIVSGNSISLQVYINGANTSYIIRNKSIGVVYEVSFDSGAYKSFETTDDFWIFRSKGGTNVRGINCKLYYFKILTSTNEAVIDLVPAKDPNGAVCMYDKVSKQFFYPNTGVLLGE